MTLRKDTPRVVRPARSVPASPVRAAPPVAVGNAESLTNARTRIVGDRAGVMADAIVALVRGGRIVREVLARAGGRISTVVTPIGWALLVAATSGFVVGYRFGIVEFAVVGFAGAILFLLAAAHLIGRSVLQVELEIPHSHVVVGSTGGGSLVVRNPSRRRVFGTRIDLPRGSSPWELALPSLAAGSETRHAFPLHTNERGVFVIGPARTVRADPLGLVSRELIWSGTVRFYVHPRTLALPSTSVGLIRDLEGQPTGDLSTSDISFHALREYVPGDERRNIHWKSTAKTGTYLVRQFEQTRRSRLVVALSLAGADFASDDEFEMAVSAAGSLGLSAIRDARDVAVVVGRETPDFAKKKLFGVRQLDSLTRSRLLDELAGVDRADTSLSLIDMARVVADQMTGISVAFLVCGSLTTPASLRAASVQFPVGVEVIAVICDPDAAPGLRRIAGLHVLTIGYLGDLARSLARAATL